MDHFSLLSEERRETALVIGIPEKAFPFPRAVSWAIRGGGFVVPRIIVNHSLDVNGAWIGDGKEYIDALLRREGLPCDSIVMMTTVSQQFQAVSDRTAEDGTCAVRTYATVGLGNALAAGDPVTPVPPFGTINLAVIVAATLSTEALLECIAIATEAKARFLHERGVTSTVSRAMATGTGTDCVTIVSLGVGECISEIGKHTKPGELLALSVMDAMEKSLALRHGALS